jgi:V8-like Glu-specific endopeptidase
MLSEAKRSVFRALGVGLWICALANSSIAYAHQTDFSIRIAPENTVKVQAGDAEPKKLQSSARLATKGLGRETIECRPNGKQSLSSGAAEVKLLKKRKDEVSFLHSALSTAKGGHSGNCIGRNGHNTTAKGISESKALLTIEFDKSKRRGRYVLEVSTAGNAEKPFVSVTDSNSKTVDAIADQPNNFILDSGHSSIFYLTTKVSVTSEDKGGCCSNTSAISARVDVRVYKAPLLWSRGTFEPFIKGGLETSSYSNVGAILIDGRLHCTGTVIGASTILTAAHCVQGYENQTNKFSFLVGSNILQPTFGPVKVTGFTYPKGEQGFKFNQSSLENDIALVYLTAPTKITPALVHLGVPRWEDILSNKSSLTFVGFGYDVIENEKVGAGVKREASWAINAIENRRVFFSVPGKNTCKGDSGGPAFKIEGGKLIQVGITSGGSPDCSTGFETRVDAFQNWLKGRVK